MLSVPGGETYDINVCAVWETEAVFSPRSRVIFHDVLKLHVNTYSIMSIYFHVTMGMPHCA